MKVYKFIIKGIQKVQTKDKSFFFYHCESCSEMPYTEGSFFCTIYSETCTRDIGEEINVLQNGRYWNILDIPG